MQTLYVVRNSFVLMRNNYCTQCRTSLYNFNECEYCLKVEVCDKNCGELNIEQVRALVDWERLEIIVRLQNLWKYCRGMSACSKAVCESWRSMWNEKSENNFSCIAGTSPLFRSRLMISCTQLFNDPRSDPRSLMYNNWDLDKNKLSTFRVSKTKRSNFFVVYKYLPT